MQAMRKWPTLGHLAHSQIRTFTASTRLREVRDLEGLRNRICPQYQESTSHDLLGLQWPSPPRNVLLVKKDNVPSVTESFIEYANHIHSTYPDMAMLMQRKTAVEVHESLPFPVYTETKASSEGKLPEKVDLISTLGGDGTILHASSMFSAAINVPPLLCFSMGTLGFLGEWKFKEYKQAFREVYMSGSQLNGNGKGPKDGVTDQTLTDGSVPAGWATIRGKFMGTSRNSRVLLRGRLKVGVFDAEGRRIKSSNTQTSAHQDMYAMNEVIIHRGADPHLAIVDVSVGGRFLTEAIADGMIVSTPTGSTAYNLSCGGSIVHPLVPSLLLTPICPRSLSFRPLVLPGNTPITLRLSEKNRGREVDVSIDGVRRSYGVGVGVELRVCGEDVHDGQGGWIGGIPSIVRGHAGSETGSEESWVGGLNSLLKFNHPLGEA